MMICKFDRIKDNEERWHAIGSIDEIVIILVAYTIRNRHHEAEVIRLISARKANKGERELYEQSKRID